MSAAKMLNVSVRDIVGRPGEMRERVLEFPAHERLGEALAWVPEGELIDLALKLESVHEGILVSAQAATTMHAECGRCLKDFTTPFQVEFQELFAYTPTEADEYEVHGDHVNLEPPLRDAVVLALPFQPVCRPDCPGLDPESGEPREIAAAVESVSDLDPRWAALASFTAGTSVEAEQEPDTGNAPGSESK